MLETISFEREWIQERESHTEGLARERAIAKERREGLARERWSTRDKREGLVKEREQEIEGSPTV